MVSSSPGVSGIRLVAQLNSSPMIKKGLPLSSDSTLIFSIEIFEELVLDIDRCEAKNHLAVVDYVEDLYLNYRNMEMLIPFKVEKLIVAASLIWWKLGLWVSALSLCKRMRRKL